MGLIEGALEQLSVKTVVFVLFVSYVIYSLVLRHNEESRLQKLPGHSHGQILNSRWPLGCDFVVRSVSSTMRHRNLQFWQHIFSSVEGWTGEARILGTRIVFTADPENIKAILATQFDSYGKGEIFHREWEEFLGDSIFTTDGQTWHDSRMLIRPQFVRDRVSDLHCFEGHVQTLFRAISNGGALNGEDQEVDMAAVNGKVVDMSELFFRFSLDVATDFLLGKDVKSLTTPRQEFAEAFNEVQRVQNILARSNKLKPLVPKKSFRHNLKVINDFVNVYIERALRLSPEELSSKTKSDMGYTFLHELASFTRDRKVIRDQLVAVLLAGRDTTAATLSWTVYELARHPEVVRRLRREIVDTVGLERTPTYADLKGMKYLQNVMNETLRLYPAVPFNVRMALKDTTLPTGGGPNLKQPISILKDTPVGYSTLVMQRREDLYPPVSENFPHHLTFAPGRWYHWQPKPWEYVPFNGGPRICIGQQFALTEISYVLCRLFQRYERVQSYMDDVDRGQPCLKAEIVLQPGQGVNVAFWEAKRE